jgi:hypothetical protein
MREVHDVEIREQCGQYGGASHTNRVYKKEVNVFSDEQIERAISAIKEMKNEKGFCRSVSLEEVRDHKYRLTPSVYNEIDFDDIPPHREYKEIIVDLNHVIDEKNGLKLTMNESLAKTLGLYDIFLQFKQSEALNESINNMLGFTGEKIEKEKFISMSKNAGELKFENGRKNDVSTILMSILQMWKQHIMYLNNEENRYLAELRDALLPELLSGKIEI